MADITSKQNLIDAVAAQIGDDITKKTVATVLEGLDKAIKVAVAEGSTITMSGLMKIAVKERAARQVRNPSTGEMMDKPADKVVKITALKSLKDSI